MKIFESSTDASELRFGVVVSRFTESISARLLESCSAELVRRGAREADIHVTWVPGAFEIPQAARALAVSGRYDAVVALGAVIRGETPHFDVVCDGVAAGVREVMRDTAVPVAFGVLTTENAAQARARAGGERGDKGQEVALVAIEMARLLPRLSKPPGEIP